MGWSDHVDLSRFIVAAAPYGGPIGKLLVKINIGLAILLKLEVSYLGIILYNDLMTSIFCVLGN